MTNQSNTRAADSAIEARYRFLLSLLIDRGVLTNQRYGNGVWSLQGIYGVDDSGIRGAGRTAEEAIDNAITMSRLDPKAQAEMWQNTFAAQPTPEPVAQAEDTLRLDHLQNTGSTIEILLGGDKRASWRFRVGGLHAAVSSDIRAAIDAARGKQPAAPSPVALQGRGDVALALAAAQQSYRHHGEPEADWCLLERAHLEVLCAAARASLPAGGVVPDTVELDGLSDWLRKKAVDSSTPDSEYTPLLQWAAQVDEARLALGSVPDSVRSIMSEAYSERNDGERALRQWSLAIARRAAWAHGQFAGSPSYLPKDTQDTKSFEPHAWVLHAISDAVQRTLMAPPVLSATPQPSETQGRRQMTDEQREAFAAGYEAAQQDAQACQLPPMGWRCTRKAGHEGPCAALETDDSELVQRGMDRLREAHHGIPASPQDEGGATPRSTRDAWKDNESPP